jgi:serine/threonine-protein kinase
MTSASAAPRLIAGRYALDALIGRGGIAEVWRARHLALNSFVAIKFLQGGSAQDEVTRRRFTTEARVTAQLKSQHAVQVFDFGVTEDGHPYIVMELLDGETLGRRIERTGRIGVLETAHILGQSSRALHKAHQIGIVHRDFKPDNVVIGLGDDGRDHVKVVDFGIAKLIGGLESAPRAAGAGEGDWSVMVPTTTFTKTDSILGTPFYMAPEQVENAAEVDPRADIWAFGIVAFECLTGQAPFKGKNLIELFQNIRARAHPDPRELEPSIPIGFAGWFDTACAVEPSKRFDDAQTAYQALVEALGCGDVDVAPPIRRDVAPPTTRESVAMRPDAVDAGPTLADSMHFGVESRRRRSQRELVAAPEIHASDTAVDAKAAASPIAEEEARFPPPPPPRNPAGFFAKRAAWVGAAVVGLSAVAMWRARATSSSGPSAASALPQAVPALPAAIESTPPPAAASALLESDVPSPVRTPSPPASASQLPIHPRVPSPQTSGTKEVASASATAPARSAPPAPTAPAPTAPTPVVDPASYR